MFSRGSLKAVKWIMDEILNNSPISCGGIHPVSVMQMEVTRNPLLHS